MTGSKDTTCRVYTLHPIEGYKPVTFTAHRDRIVTVVFAKDSLDVYTVSRDGSCMVWRHQDRAMIERIREEQGIDAAASALKPAPPHRWSLNIAEKHYFLQDHAKVRICTSLYVHQPTLHLAPIRILTST